MKNLLVLCEGNICRSPMAAGLLSARLPQFATRSAGLGALVGEPADPLAVSLLQARGIDISGHRAVQVTRKMCLDSDVVLVMDRAQRKRLEELYPESRGRVFRLGEFTDQDIPDPYRLPERAFRHALELIDAGVERWLQRIERL
ncbi:low molecular weight phosphotyrosine protein phosphatase [Ramlibacter ginsenosidimutans]|uniref:protein-tyrosine-phosphatase n=1 Tax=Ramlibacter ginsenosidimutans TaxID=502333 RepID=A0A934WQ10_9BURK|nr:low molecular weight phosphotyrosine protein phosphatase [Ramlibacter ginsenosidimutans]